MRELIVFISRLVDLYTYVVWADVILGWLMQWNVVNPYQPTVRSIAQMLHVVTEPLLRPIRQLLPRTSGIDFSPFVLLLACLFVQTVVLPNLIKEPAHRVWDLYPSRATRRLFCKAVRGPACAEQSGG